MGVHRKKLLLGVLVIALAATLYYLFGPVDRTPSPDQDQIERFAEAYSRLMVAKHLFRHTPDRLDSTRAFILSGSGFTPESFESFSQRMQADPELYLKVVKIAAARLDSLKDSEEIPKPGEQAKRAKEPPESRKKKPELVP